MQWERPPPMRDALKDTSCRRPLKKLNTPTHPSRMNCGRKSLGLSPSYGKIRQLPPRSTRVIATSLKNRNRMTLLEINWMSTHPQKRTQKGSSVACRLDANSPLGTVRKQTLLLASTIHTTMRRPPSCPPTNIIVYIETKKDPLDIRLGAPPPEVIRKQTNH